MNFVMQKSALGGRFLTLNRFLILDLLLGCFGDAKWCAIVETVQQKAAM